MVEDLRGRASAGMDIGGTFIGNAPASRRGSRARKTRRIGEANLTMARTRPKYVGGPRRSRRNAASEVLRMCAKNAAHTAKNGIQ